MKNYCDFLFGDFVCFASYAATLPTTPQRGNAWHLPLRSIQSECHPAILFGLLHSTAIVPLTMRQPESLQFHLP